MVREIGQGNDLSPVQRQAIIWIKKELLLIGPLLFNKVLVKFE